jgi:hypothetical protein
MPFTRILGFGLSLVIVVTVLSSVGSAQIKRPLRWLGQGFSDGYHQCTPGPNSDYYNPYSEHNTYLYYQQQHPSPGYSEVSNNRRTQVNRSVPYSVYAAPATVDNDPTFTILPAEVNGDSLVPYKQGPPSKSDNDWQAIPTSTNEAKENKKDSAFAPQLKNRIRQRFADAHGFTKRVSIGNR